MKIIFLNILETSEVRSQLISEKSFNLQLTSKFPSKPVDAGALVVSSCNWGRNSPWSFSNTSNWYATKKSSDGNLSVRNELLLLHDAIYRLRFYSISLIRILLLSNSQNNVTSIELGRYIAWLHDVIYWLRF